MATKKCPKCGEENPAEAVMCWACYTPLAGGAAAVAGGGLVTPRGGAAAVTPAGTAAAQEEQKSAVDPKIFIVVGLLIGAAIIGSFTTGIIGGGGKSDAGTTVDVNQVDDGGDTGVGEPIPAPRVPAPAPQPPVFPSVPDSTGQTQVAPQTKVVVPPDPRQTVGTMGIVLNSPNVSTRQALALAKFAKQQFEPGGKWKGMQVVVFNNQEAAVIFRKYQAQRQGKPLTASQYQELADQGLWSNVPAYYETRGKTEYPYSPSASPKNWWAGRR